MAKQDNNRTRASLPISGLDTSTPDLTVADGKCEELHNLRWTTGGWANVKPLNVLNSASGSPAGQDFFKKLSIVYHHPAADDNAYIASYPNDDGTINLYQVLMENGSLSHYPYKNLNPIYLRIIITRQGTVISLQSLKPVASDVTVDIDYSDSTGNKETRQTIPKDSEMSQGLSLVNEYEVKILNSETVVPTPAADDTYTYRFYETEAEALISIQGTFACNLPADVKISHFGNVLILTDFVNKDVKYYYMADGTYKVFQIPKPPEVRQSPILSINAMYSTDGTTYNSCTQISQYRVNEVASGVPVFNISTGVFYISQINADFFWGEICYFAIFQMADGSLLAPSALSIAASEPFFSGQSARTYETPFYQRSMCLPNFFTATENGENILKIKSVPNSGYANTPHTFWIRPYITITIPKTTNTNLIKSVNIYSTRINPIWDSEKLKQINENQYLPSIMMPEFWADNKLPEQPFYFVKSIPIDHFSEGQYNMYLGGELLKDIEQNTTYKPIDTHFLFYDVAKEYNSRLHIGGNAGLRLFDGYGSGLLPASTDIPQYDIITNVRINDVDYHVKAAATQPLNSYTTFVYNKILSYPDYRATFIHAPESVNAPCKIPLQEATANNFAYAVCRDAETYDGNSYFYVKYSAAIFKGMRPNHSEINATDTYISQSNKLRVSAPNNPFSFPLENSYAIGTENNRILAVNSAAIEMSDAKFGEFPLYVFTEEGIFAMQSGNGEVLYSATIPINYDRVINPNTLAVNQNILYITARGIHAMFSNQSKLISESINDLQNMPPLDYLRSARLYYQHPFNEVIVWDGRKQTGDYSKAYVYSLDGGYWSTRDFEGIKLNTDEIVARNLSWMASASGQPPIDAIAILDLNEERSRTTSPTVRLITRPIKLGSVEFKRLETFILRMFAPVMQGVQFRFEASVDLKTWRLLRDSDLISADGDIAFRRFPFSFRYLRVILEVDVYQDFKLTMFDLEYYMRFMHRLR